MYDSTSSDTNHGCKAAEQATWKADIANNLKAQNITSLSAHWSALMSRFTANQRQAERSAIVPGPFRVCWRLQRSVSVGSTRLPAASVMLAAETTFAANAQLGLGTGSSGFRERAVHRERGGALKASHAINRRRHLSNRVFARDFSRVHLHAAERLRTIPGHKPRRPSARENKTALGKRRAA